MGDVPPGDNVAINFGGIGDIDMNTAPTLTVMNSLAQVGSTFGDAWSGLHDQIKAEEAALGDPVLGDIVSSAFREGYNRAEPDLSLGANAIPPQYDLTADSGRAAVGMYLQTDGHEVPAALNAAAARVQSQMP